MKIMNMRRLIAASLIALAFTACAVDASVNDGSAAETRLSKGYKKKPKKAAGGGSGAPAVPFSGASYTGIQIWSNGESTKVELSDEYVTLTELAGWIGGSFGAWDKTGGNPIGSYDMSSVSTVKFKARGTAGKTLVLSFPNGNAPNIQITATLSADWKEFEGNTSQKLPNSVVDLLTWSGGNACPKVADVKDITFYDSNGKEVTPTYTPDE